MCSYNLIFYKVYKIGLPASHLVDFQNLHCNTFMIVFMLQIKFRFRLARFGCLSNSRLRCGKVHELGYSLTHLVSPSDFELVQSAVRARNEFVHSGQQIANV